jgi:hypothetical protein
VLIDFDARTPVEVVDRVLQALAHGVYRKVAP